MARESFARLALLTYRTLEALMTFLFPAWYGPSAAYRPENHYMRGPGPKWRARYLAESVSPARSITSSRPGQERCGDDAPCRSAAVHSVQTNDSTIAR
jgi:hypothetical protein